MRPHAAFGVAAALEETVYRAVRRYCRRHAEQPGRALEQPLLDGGAVHRQAIRCPSPLSHRRPLPAGPGGPNAAARRRPPIVGNTIRRATVGKATRKPPYRTHRPVGRPRKRRFRVRGSRTAADIGRGIAAFSGRMGYADRVVAAGWSGMSGRGPLRWGAGADNRRFPVARSDLKPI